MYKGVMQEKLNEQIAREMASFLQIVQFWGAL